MAASTLVFETGDGETTLVAQCFTEDTDTLATNGTSSTAVEFTSNKGKYTCTFTDLASGTYDLRIKDGSNNTIARGKLKHTNAVGVERPSSLDWADLIHQDATVNLSNTTIGNVSGLGTGARTVTPLVQTSGAVPLEGASIRFTKGVETYVSTTDANGQVASFNLDDGTWTVAITLYGYSFAGTTLVVNGDETPTYTMTTVVIPAPSSPLKVVGVLLCLDVDEDPEEGVEVTFKKTSGPGDAGYSLDSEEVVETSDVDGLITREFLIGATYKVRRSNGAAQSFVAPATTPFNIAEHLGNP